MNSFLDWFIIFNIFALLLWLNFCLFKKSEDDKKKTQEQYDAQQKAEQEERRKKFQCRPRRRDLTFFFKPDVVENSERFRQSGCHFFLGDIEILKDPKRTDFYWYDSPSGFEPEAIRGLVDHVYYGHWLDEGELDLPEGIHTFEDGSGKILIENSRLKIWAKNTRALSDIYFKLYPGSRRDFYSIT